MFGQRAIPAPYALPAAFAMFLAVGTAAAALNGRLPAGGVLILCAGIACFMSFAAEPVAAVRQAALYELDKSHVEYLTILKDSADAVWRFARTPASTIGTAAVSAA